MIERLATGGLALGQYAQAVTMDGEGIKQVETLVGNATAQRANGTEMPLTAGAPFYAGDVLQTLAEASIGIVLAKKYCRLARIAVCFSMSSFTFQAQNGGDGREYHLRSLHIRERRDRESRTGRNDRLQPPFRDSRDPGHESGRTRRHRCFYCREVRSSSNTARYRRH